VPARKPIARRKGKKKKGVQENFKPPLGRGQYEGPLAARSVSIRKENGKATRAERKETGNAHSAGGSTGGQRRGTACRATRMAIEPRSTSWGTLR